MRQILGRHAHRRGYLNAGSPRHYDYLAYPSIVSETENINDEVETEISAIDQREDKVMWCGLTPWWSCTNSTVVLC